MEMLLTVVMLFAGGFTLFWFFAYTSLLRENSRFAGQVGHIPADRMETEVIRAARAAFPIGLGTLLLALLVLAVIEGI